MKHVISLQNIKIPSLNKKHAVVKGRMILTKEYREFKELLLISIKKGSIKPPYDIMIVVSTNLDYDNTLKCIGDALETAGIINNDKNIFHADISKYPIKRGELGSLNVYVGTL